MKAAASFVRTPLRAAWRERNPLKRLAMRRPWFKFLARKKGNKVADALGFDAERKEREAPDLAPLYPELDMFYRVAEQWNKFEVQPDLDRVIGIKEGVYFTLKDGVEWTPELKSRFDYVFRDYKDGPYDKSLSFNRDVHEWLERWQDRECDDQEFLVSGGLASTYERDIYDSLEDHIDYMEYHVWNEDNVFDKLANASEKSLPKLKTVLSESSLDVEISDYLGSKQAIRNYAARLREEMDGLCDLEPYVPQVYALVTRACQVLRDTKTKFMKDGREKEWNLVPWDVQLLSALAMKNTEDINKVIEQMTAEGKTITASLPIILHAFAGTVDVFTHNNTLAERDREWLAPLFDLLGITTTTVGVNTNQNADERCAAYKKRVRYGTVEGFGFDYLFGSLERSPDRNGFKPADFGFLDEFDDRAKKITPMIANAPNFASYRHVSPEEERKFLKAARLAKQFAGIEESPTLVGDSIFARFDADYIFDVEKNGICIQPAGLAKIVEEFNLDSVEELFNGEFDVYSKMHNAIKAEQFFKEGEHYRVWRGDMLKAHFRNANVNFADDEYSVQLIDEGTGHLALNHRFRDGLHEALTAKEIVKKPGINMHIEEGQVSSASITVQTFLRKFYPTFSACTGTMAGLEEEVETIYNA
ncbi:hypothetical protein KY329_00790, partial [Candidatus Woesearchaeota archaeon]|nr:hypothetical protein [Candidatus Woesearchaeota archaeon]